jgi:hypothetical protein
VISIMTMVARESDVPSAALVVAHTRQLDLHAVHTVDTVNEQDQNEYKRYLDAGQMYVKPVERGYHTFMPYCNFATIGLSEMKVKSLRRQVNGSGTIRARKMSISVTKRRKTWKHNNCKHGGHISALVVGSSVGTRAAAGRYRHCHSPWWSLPADCSSDGSGTYQTVVERHIDCVVALRSGLMFGCGQGSSRTARGAKSVGWGGM